MKRSGWTTANYELETIYYRENNIIKRKLYYKFINTNVEVGRWRKKLYREDEYRNGLFYASKYFG